MKICIAGKNNIAVNVCSYLLREYPQFSILVIKNRTDIGIDGFQRSFWKFADDNKLSIVSLEDVYNIPDLVFLSLEFDRIIIPDKFLSKRLFNIHFSLLPEYKGMYTSALPILHGKDYSGVTLHKINSGIDTGDILCQKKIDLTSMETAKTLYIKYIEVGTSLVVENIDSILNDTYISTTQYSKHSSYFSKSSLDYSNIQIDLNVTAFQLDCQVRAFNFRDYQLPNIYKTDIVGTFITEEQSHFKPGKVLEDNRNYFCLSTIDYNIQVYKDRFAELLEYCKLDDLEGVKSISCLDIYLSESEKKYGWTPLMISAYNNSVAICEYLIKCGADVNARNFNGTTVIMYAKDAALRTGDYAIIDVFLKNASDPYIQDYSGKNLFDYLENQSIELFDYIKKK